MILGLRSKRNITSRRDEEAATRQSAETEYNESKCGNFHLAPSQTHPAKIERIKLPNPEEIANAYWASPFLLCRGRGAQGGGAERTGKYDLHRGTCKQSSPERRCGTRPLRRTRRGVGCRILPQIATARRVVRR